MKSKKGLELSLNVVVMGIIIIVVLIFILLFFTGFGSKLFAAISGQADTSKDLLKDVPLP